MNGGHDRQTLILGAGLTGLAAARTLQSAGRSFQLIEAGPSAGGLTRSMQIGDFTFDYTGHLLHLARHDSPSRLPLAGLRDGEWQQIDRKSVCWLGERFIPAPIQYHLGHLPEPLASQCIESYRRRPLMPKEDEATFRDYLVSGFGEKLADAFLIAQNEKTMATELRRLSTHAVKRFFPPPDEDRVRAGIEGDRRDPAGYNSKFWYPKMGGINRLVRGLAEGIESIAFMEEAIEIDLNKRRLLTRGGNRWEWDALLTSMPLRRFCERTTDRDLNEWARSLTHCSTIVFNLGCRGTVPPQLHDIHWIYVPDRKLPFYRVGFYSNISAGLCPPDCHSLYVEVGVRPERLGEMDIVQRLQSEVLGSLTQLGWIRAESVICCAVHIIPCAYVHHTPERERVIPLIFERLRSHGVYPMGRYGLWDYISMEDSIESGMETAKGML